ncbi:MAG: hypothetical protein K1X86_00050 [Ignavibacteria bacterium]|nr:hypothetical protein [Ignavibacteria bacterium]
MLIFFLDSVSKTASTLEDGTVNLDILIPVCIIILLSGLIGGWVNYLLISEDNLSKVNSDRIGTTNSQLLQSINKLKKIRLLMNLLFGIIASALTPILFLTVNENFFDEMSTGDYLKFTAFCLLAAYSSRKFIDSMMEQLNKIKKDVLKNELEVKKAEEKVEKAQEQVNLNKKEIDSAKEKVEELDKSFNSGTSKKTSEDYEKVKAANVERFDNYPNDIQKGKWGKKSESNNRKLIASVREIQTSWLEKFEIILTVESTDEGKHPLSGTVLFHLHQSFPKMVREIEVKNGKANLKIYAYGAFTVGAVADKGATKLELDLAELPNAPKEFKEN